MAPRRPPPRRAGVAATVAACAAALALAPAAPAAPAAWKHFPSSGAVHASASKAISPGTVLRRAERAFEKPAVVPPRRDLSPLLRRLALDLPRLHGDARRRAAGLLARPDEGGADPQQNGWSAAEAQGSPFCSAHYCVHWVASGSDAPDLTDANGNGVPDWVETVSATAENVHAVENGQLGWRTPKGDGSMGGGGQNLTDIYLVDVGGSGIYGYAAPDPQPDNHALFAYLVLDNDFAPGQFPGYAGPVTPLQVTLAHEYNHVLQFNYDAFEETWMLESTAVWMEGKVYDSVHDYLQYLPGWVALTKQPLTTFDGSDPNSRKNVKVYGSGVWNKWLDARYGQDVVRQAWEDSVKATSFAPSAYDAAIRQHGGPGFAADFASFSAATAEWQAPNSGFPEGSLYPDVERAGQLAVNSAPAVVDLDHTTFALVDVPVSSAPRIRLAVASPPGTSSSLALVGRTGTGLVQTEQMLPGGGHGVVTFENPGGLSRLTAVLVNSDVQHGPFSSDLQDYPFKRNKQQFYAHVSTDFTRPRITGGTFGTKKVTVRFSEPILGASKSSLKLAGISATVKFTPGSRSATLVAKRPFARGTHRVRVTAAITDLTLNRLHATTLSFTVR